MLDSKAPKLILFDLGGVLVELGESPLPKSWLTNDQRLGLKEWFGSSAARQFETGRINAVEFAQEMQKEFNINKDVEQIIEQFSIWPQGLFPGTEQLLQQIRQRYRIAILSNCNELHWPRLLNEMNLAALTEFAFSSHLLGMAKPDPEIFKCVLEALALEPQQVLFFDDNQANVDSAAQCGLLAVRVQGPRDIKNYFQSVTWHQ